MSVSRVLVLRNSVSGAASFSNKGIDRSLVALKQAFPGVAVVDRDLVKNPVPMLNEETFAAIRNNTLETENQKKADALANELIEEIKSVDLVLCGLPRYNFGTPTTFKSYLDYIGRPRITFRYTEKGPEGLLPNIPFWGIMTAGGMYGEDHYNQWIKSVLPLFGLKDISLFPVVGTGMGKGEESLAKLDVSVAEAINALLKNRNAKL